MFETICTNLEVPFGISPENSGVFIIDHVVNRLHSQFRFGYHEPDDMRQEGRLFAIEAISKKSYDNTRPLEKFLYVAVRSRYINMIRDNLHRSETPCKRCPFYDPKNLKSINQCAVFEDKFECSKYKNWSDRNASKKSLMNFAPESDAASLVQDREYAIDYRDTIEFLRKSLSKDHYDNFVLLLAGTLSADLIPETREIVATTLGATYGETK